MFSLKQESQDLGLSMIDPSISLCTGRVYTRPVVCSVEAAGVSDRVRRRAEKLQLPLQQEHMQIGIAQALVKPRSPKNKCDKSGILNRILKRL